MTTVPVIPPWSGSLNLDSRSSCVMTCGLPFPYPYSLGWYWLAPVATITTPCSTVSTRSPLEMVVLKLPMDPSIAVILDSVNR